MQHLYAFTRFLVAFARLPACFTTATLTNPAQSARYGQAGGLDHTKPTVNHVHRRGGPLSFIHAVQVVRCEDSDVGRQRGAQRIHQGRPDGKLPITAPDAQIRGAGAIYTRPTAGAELPVATPGKLARPADTSRSQRTASS